MQLSQHSATCLYLEPDYSTLWSFYLFTMHFNTKLPLRIGLPSSLFPSGVITGARLVFVFITKIPRDRKRATSHEATQHRQFTCLLTQRKACWEFRTQATATSFHTPYNLSFNGDPVDQWKGNETGVTWRRISRGGLFGGWNRADKYILLILDIRQNRMFWDVGTSVTNKQLHILIQNGILCDVKIM